MKNLLFFIFATIFLMSSVLFHQRKLKQEVLAKECVFNTIFSEVEIDSTFKSKPLDTVISSTQKGIDFLMSKQQANGGWGAMTLDIRDKVGPTDPATTAMVAMALLRSNVTIDKGPNAEALAKATDYLLEAAEAVAPDNSNIPTSGLTQIQRKLGNRIDLVLATQYFTNLLPTLKEGSQLQTRVFQNINYLVDKIQLAQDAQGRMHGGGWAGVLQSALANNALETAQVNGGWVDEQLLAQSRSYQKGNYDTSTNKVATVDGAGIVLYAVAGTARASAKEARTAKQLIESGISSAVLDSNAVVSQENLRKMGVDADKAMLLHTAFQIYTAAKAQAQDSKVLKGFGNNGGEEFISYLQTGESMIIHKDEAWKQWFQNISGQLLKVQKKNGSWSGHHCITSPIFCTATCILVLSINNDIEQLVRIGA